MTIVEQFEVPSDSSPGTLYRVSVHDDGSYSCACRGWTMHTPRRDCKHIAVAKAGFARACDPLLVLIVKANHAAARKRERKALQSWAAGRLVREAA